MQTLLLVQSKATDMLDRDFLVIWAFNPRKIKQAGKDKQLMLKIQ